MPSFLFKHLIVAVSLGVFFCGIASIHAAVPDVTVGLAAVSANPGSIISQIFNFALVLSGLLAFVMIVWGGVKYGANPGNSGAQSDAKDQILQAVLGLLLLFGSVLVLNTINPEIMKTPVPPLTKVTIIPVTAVVPASSTLCSNIPALAAKYRVPATPKDSPGLSIFKNCILTKIKGTPVPAIFTYEQDNPLCNFTRGEPICGKCAHSSHSCHYGGTNGQQGAEAIDFSLGAAGTTEVANKIMAAAKACDAGAFAQYETFPATPNRNHVHVSMGGRSGCN